MKKIQIYTKLVFDIIMGIIMIPFLLVGVFIIGLSLLLHFPYWKLKKERKR